MRAISRGICGATLALAAGHAGAQSSVTLYGVVDVFGQYLNNGGTDSLSERSGGSTGSLLGFKGSDNLGAGIDGRIDLESGFNVNNGTFFADSNALFYRQAWIGLSHADFGSLTLGRQYQPSFKVAYPADPFRINEVISPLAAAVLAIDRNTLSTQYATGRTSNSINYQSPNLSGFTFNAMYAFSATVTQPLPSTSGNLLRCIGNLFQLWSVCGFRISVSARWTAELSWASRPPGSGWNGSLHGGIGLPVRYREPAVPLSVRATRRRRVGFTRGPSWYGPFRQHCGSGGDDSGDVAGCHPDRRN